MDDNALDAWINAGTAALGIAMKPDWQQAVRMHLRISLDHAKTVLDTPVEDGCDPAPVFRA